MAATKSVVLFRSPSTKEEDKYHKELMSKRYTPYSIPVLAFDFENLDELANVIQKPQDHGGMIITSQRSVEAIELSISKHIPKEKWLEVLQSQWQSLHLFAVGTATATAMKSKLGLTCSGQESGSAEKLVPIIKQAMTHKDKPLVFPCGNLRKETIPVEMENAGIKLTSVQVYKTIPKPDLQQVLQEHVKMKGLPSVIVFFSPSGLEFTLDFLKEITGDLSNIKNCVNQVAIPQCLSALANYLQFQATTIQRLSQELQTAKQEVEKVKKSIGRWPAGSYCILAGGTCPSGFTKKSGYMRALNMYSHTHTYIKSVNFGSSKIACHGRCGQYGNWVGDFFIEACCK